jgi:hypothetical protein
MGMGGCVARLAALLRAAATYACGRQGPLRSGARKAARAPHLGVGHLLLDAGQQLLNHDVDLLTHGDLGGRGRGGVPGRLQAGGYKAGGSTAAEACRDAQPLAHGTPLPQGAARVLPCVAPAARGHACSALRGARAGAA